MSKSHNEMSNFPLAASLALQRGDFGEAVRIVRRDCGVDPATAEATVNAYVRSHLGSGIDVPQSISPSEIIRNPAFLRVLVLDSVGGIAAALGLAAKFAHVEILPPPWRFPHYEWVLIVGGVLLMLPMVFYLLGRNR